MAIRSNPTAFVTKWKSGVSASGTNYSTGIQNSADWASATAGAADRWAAGVQAAIANGRFTTGVQALGTAAWRSVTAAKGPANWQNGVQNSAKIQNGAQKLFNMLQTAESSISSVPRGTYEQNMVRQRTWADSMHASRLAGL